LAKEMHYILEPPEACNTHKEYLRMKFLSHRKYYELQKKIE
jgi:hypothetical protein